MSRRECSRSVLVKNKKSDGREAEGEVEEKRTQINPLGLI